MGELKAHSVQKKGEEKEKKEVGLGRNVLEAKGEMDTQTISLCPVIKD